MLYWLGQAGFIIQARARRLIIDRYLSDTLAGLLRDGTGLRFICASFQ